MQVKLNRLECVALLVVLAFQETLLRRAEMSCVVTETCVLPCTFNSGTDMVIHWTRTNPNSTSVHYYYHTSDELADQDQRFRGRTSLFEDQLSRGNASLLLTALEVQDEGAYMCHTSTSHENKQFLFNLEVDAPVHQVNIQQAGDMITCSSEGIYPKPELAWSTRPPSVIFKNSPSIQQSEKQLYSISNSLLLAHSYIEYSDLEYSCIISTRRSRKTATLFKATSLSGLDSETTIPCAASNTPLTSLIWRFNHSQIIAMQNETGGAHTASEEWRQRVKDVSESGSLTLRRLSAQHNGVYTCELTNADGTLITNTFLHITEDSSTKIGVAVAVFLLLAAAGITGLVLWRCRSNNSRAAGTPNHRENPEQRQNFMEIGQRS